MSRAEFCDWFDRYDAAPFDDRHRYHRPAAWLTMALNGTQPRESLEWLTNGRLTPQDAPEGVPEGDWSEADIATMRALGVGRKG